MLKILFVFVGLCVGVLQFFLLGKITSAIVSPDRAHIALFIAAKVALYIVLFAVILLFQPYLLFTAAGYGVGIIAGSLINFAIRR
ncbi:MAG: hypothetical protein IJO77_08565 [Oscillospiraceae bacterium]|nr:hypothetical protein [Oscillospiraceae bacterium]